MHLPSRKPKTILYTHYGDEWIRGSERCLLDLLSHLNRKHFKPVVWCNSTIMASEVRRLDIPVIQSEFPLLPELPRPLSSVKSYYNLVIQGIQLVDTYNVDLIHVNSGAPSQWLNLVARARQLPLLTHLHSFYPLRDRVMLGLHHLAMVVGVSQSVINQLLQDGVPSDSCCVIPNGIDTLSLDNQPRCKLRRMLGLNKNDFLIITAGSLIYRKGFDLIINSVRQLINMGIPAQLIIIGDGPERANLLQQSQKLNIKNRVHFLGEQSNVSGLLHGGADLFVSAAREEAFGLVLAEASLAGLAVIAPDIGSIQDIIINEETGKLFPAENVTELTQKIFQLFLSAERRFDMGVAGRQHIINHFTIQHNVQKFEQLYNRMLQNPTMRMRWYSHWKLCRPFIHISKQLFNLTLKKLCRRNKK